MNIKEYLNQAYCLDGLIRANRRELTKLRELAESVKSPVMSFDRIEVSGVIDRVGERVARIIDLENEIQRDIDRLIQAKTDIRRTIMSVADLKLRLILTERYLNLRKWERISADNNYSYSPPCGYNLNFRNLLRICPRENKVDLADFAKNKRKQA